MSSVLFWLGIMNAHNGVSVCYLIRSLILNSVRPLNQQRQRSLSRRCHHLHSSTKLNSNRRRIFISCVCFRFRYVFEKESKWRNFNLKLPFNRWINLFNVTRKNRHIRLETNYSELLYFLCLSKDFSINCLCGLVCMLRNGEEFIDFLNEKSNVPRKE